MTEQDKYYIPSIEEFHVGFEYERCDAGYGYFKDTFPRAINFQNSNCEYEDFLKRHIQYFRVKFLDKEDIESLGWKYVIPNDGKYTIDDYYSIVKDFPSQYTSIEYKLRVIGENTCIWSDATTYFDGIIKNKSELIRIMIQTQII